MQISDTDSNLKLLVRAKEIEDLYAQSFPAVAISFIIASFVVTILWSVQQHTILITWFSAILCATIARILLFVRYKQVKPLGNTHLQWENPYFISHAISILIWGLGAVWIMPKDSLLYQTTIVFFLMGIAGGSLSVYAPHRIVTLMAVFGSLLPITLWFLFYGNSLITMSIATSCLIFFTSAVRVSNKNAQTRYENIALTHQLQLSTQQAEKLARTDELTGLYNRRAFYETAEVLFKTNRRIDQNVALILMDIDHFKRINDTFGHIMGDAVLTQIGEMLQQTTRTSDTCARIGGEEFAIIFLSPSLDDAITLAEKIRLVIANTPILVNHQTLSITASLGVTIGEKSIKDTLRSADEAMYQAKGAGRNRVISMLASEKIKD